MRLALADNVTSIVPGSRDAFVSTAGVRNASAALASAGPWSA
jgi:hypothetical protein